MITPCKNIGTNEVKMLTPLDPSCAKTIKRLRYQRFNLYLYFDISIIVSKCCEILLSKTTETKC